MRISGVGLGVLLFLSPLYAGQSGTQTLQEGKDAGQVGLSFLEEKFIPGNFLGSQSVYADRDFIYLASYQGTLFVLERDKEVHFPLIEAVPVSS